MKKLLFVLSILLLTFSHSLLGQTTFLLHGVHVPPKNHANFESQEIEYSSLLAQDFVNSGKLRGWALLKRVSGIGHGQDYKFNYFYSSSSKQ